MVYVIVEFVRTVPVPDFDSVRFDEVFTAVTALAQLVVVQPAPGVAGLVPPLGSTEAKFVIEPVDDGAVVVIVNVFVPFAELAARLVDKDTVQVSSAPEEFRFVQLTPVTPVPAAAAVAVT